ncbi:V-type ATP synthase subunit D [Candidatus Altiarchaeota archaeon]
MTDEVIEGVHPTRMDLLKLKHKHKLASKGHRLLKEKRDALMVEFMNTAREADDVVAKACENLRDAYEKYSIASALTGQISINSSVLSTGRQISVISESRNVMGIGVEQFSMEDPSRELDERGYGLYTSNPSIDAASIAYERALSGLVELAGVENTLRSLSDETKKTKRRVNALEYRVMPRIKATMKYIVMRLDEMERESFFRLKMIKKKKTGG